MTKGAKHRTKVLILDQHNQPDIPVTRNDNRYLQAPRQEMRIQMHPTIRYRPALLIGTVLLVGLLTVGSTMAVAQFVGPTPLQLINGWANSPFGTSVATVEEVAGIVQFRGAIVTSGTNEVPFVLPSPFRPAANVGVPVDLCNANKGTLIIQPNGTVSVAAENGLFVNAQCFTSLDGASFAPSATGFQALTLINGWTNFPFGSSPAAVELINGIVHFRGAIETTGTNPVPFVLPAAFRPTTAVYVPIDTCNATNSSNGRLFIQPNGTVTVNAENDFANAQCYTSLDGAWFVKTANGSRALTLINGWTNAPFSTSSAMAENAYGIVYFKGAIATVGTNAQPFVLPPAFTPVTNVYVPIDLCNATKGRLFIQTSGAVTVQAQNGVFGNAQCFTSLDGVSFVQ